MTRIQDHFNLSRHSHNLTIASSLVSLNYTPLPYDVPKDVLEVTCKETSILHIESKA